MLVNDLRFLMRFNTSSLYEEVSQTYMSLLGGEASPQIISGGGYAMQNTQYLVGEGIGFSGYSLNIDDAMTLGFWLYPVNPGMATDATTGNAVGITMPLIDFNDIGSGDISIINLTETTTIDEKNYLTVSFNGEAYSASSETYASGRWHFFWIVYHAGTLEIYVDGSQHILQDVTGSIPGTLNASNLDVYINHSLNGYAYNIAKNYGYISDIFVFNTISRNVSYIQRAINDGIEYIVDDTFTDTYIEKASIFSDDPTTITVTSAVDDMSYVYLGRNDGKILRGTPLLWESRKIYSGSQEADLLDLIYYNVLTIDSNNVSGGFLTLKDKIIEL